MDEKSTVPPPSRCKTMPSSLPAYLRTFVTLLTILALFYMLKKNQKDSRSSSIPGCAHWLSILHIHTFLVKLYGRDKKQTIVYHTHTPRPHTPNMYYFSVDVLFYYPSLQPAHLFLYFFLYSPFPP